MTTGKRILQLEMPLVTRSGRSQVRYWVSTRDLGPEECDFVNDFLNRHLPRELNVLSEAGLAELSPREQSAHTARTRQEQVLRERVLAEALAAAKQHFGWRGGERKCAVIVQLEMPINAVPDRGA